MTKEKPPQVRQHHEAAADHPEATGTMLVARLL